MEEKQLMILETLIEQLKINAADFGNIACVTNCGKHFVVSDIAMQKEKEIDIYRVIVVRHSIEKTPKTA